MATGHVSRCVLLPHRNAGRLHWGKAESIQLCDFRVVKPLGYMCRSAILVYDSHYATPSSFPILRSASEITYIVSGGALTLLTHSLSILRLPPLPLFNEGLMISPWGNCGIEDVWMYVLEHFDGLMRLSRLIIFPWNKQVNSPPNFLNFCRPRISVTHFASPGMPLDAPGCCGLDG